MVFVGPHRAGIGDDIIEQGMRIDCASAHIDRKQDEFAGASEDAWNRTLEFIEHHGR